MKVLVVGNGFVSKHLGLSIIEDRINNQPQVDKLFDHHKPDVIINCIGYCGSPNIDVCEVNRVRTFSSNVTVPLLLAEACSSRGVRMIHIGSGCIFMGPSPSKNGWKESDTPNPKSYYSKTKYAADLALDGVDGVTILRIRMPISIHPSPRNIISKLINYSEVIDEPNSMTFMKDLVRCVDHVIEKDLTGIYNVTSPLPITATELMKEYQIYHPEHQFKTIGLERLSELTTAPRSNCILDSSKLEATGFSFEGSVRDTVRSFCEVG
jgi:dTDP-4-dehydrorhamnose reductase